VHLWPAEQPQTFTCLLSLVPPTLSDCARVPEIITASKFSPNKPLISVAKSSGQVVLVDTRTSKKSLSLQNLGTSGPENKVLEEAVTDIAFTGEEGLALRDHFGVKWFDLRKPDQVVSEALLIEKEFKHSYASNAIFDLHRLSSLGPTDSLVTSHYGDQIVAIENGAKMTSLSLKSELENQE
jgi:hypothetical protein